MDENSPQQEQKRERIKNWMVGALCTVALSVDLWELLLEWLGIGLVINVVTTPAFSLIFWMWFRMLDVPFAASPKKFFTLAVTCLAELIPGLDAMGGFFWTIGTVLIIIFVKLEDKGGIVGELAGATTRIMSARYKEYKNIMNDPEKLRGYKRKFGKSVFAISKKEIVAEAMGKTKEYNAEKMAETTKGMDELQSDLSNVLNLKNKSGTNKK